MDEDLDISEEEEKFESLAKSKKPSLFKVPVPVSKGFEEV